MKTTQAFVVYLMPGLENGELPAVLAELGIEGLGLDDSQTVITPALVLHDSGEEPPPGLGDMAFAVPKDASRAALRELLRSAMENAALKRELKQLEEQARRQHRQFEELNRIGIALSAERDIGKLQEFILMTMRQLTNADGASLWRKTVEIGRAHV